MLDPEDTGGLVALIDATDTESLMAGGHGAVGPLRLRLLNVLHAIPFMGRHLRLADLLRQSIQIEPAALDLQAAPLLTDLRTRALHLLAPLRILTADTLLVELV